MSRGGGRVQRGVCRCLLLHGQASVARGQLAAGIGAERTANAENYETGGVMAESRRHSPVSAVPV